MPFAISFLLTVAITVWVAVEAARRQRRWIAWAAFVSLTGWIGLIVWLFVRRRGHGGVSPLGVRRAAEVSVSAFGLALLMVMGITLMVTFVYQVARVEGQAMAPTLADQDRVVINKWVYRRREPRAGDIVMFFYPLDPRKSFLKRVIAEQGDRVRIVAGKVYRNDNLLDDSFVPAEYRSVDDWGPQVVPQGYYFVMGDHRNNSSDSRHWGFVPRRYIIGKVQLRWWPFGQARMFTLAGQGDAHPAAKAVRIHAAVNYSVSGAQLGCPASRC
jgi:signal peptidase I